MQISKRECEDLGTRNNELLLTRLSRMRTNKTCPFCLTMCKIGSESESVTTCFSCTVYYECSLYYVEFESLSLRIILYESYSPRFGSCILRCESEPSEEIYLYIPQLLLSLSN